MLGEGKFQHIESKKFLLLTVGVRALIWGPGGPGQLRKESLCCPVSGSDSPVPTFLFTLPIMATHRVLMPFCQKNPQCSTPSDPQWDPGPGAAQVSKALEETCLLPSCNPQHAWESSEFLLVFHAITATSQADQMRAPVAKRKKIASQSLGQTPQMCP